MPVNLPDSAPTGIRAALLKACTSRRVMNMDSGDYQKEPLTGGHLPHGVVRAIGEPPLGLDVQRGHRGLVSMLLQSGADPNISGWMGRTARIRADDRHDAKGKAISKTLAHAVRKL